MKITDKQRKILEKLFKELEELDNKYNNISNTNVFELAIYLYIRYGEIPVELYDKLEELGKYFNNKENIFCEDINYNIEDIIIGDRDNEK